MSTDAWIEEHWIGEAVLPRPRRAPKLPALPVPHAPTCSRGNAALAAHAQSRDRARHPGDGLSSRQNGRNVLDQQARKLTQPPAVAGIMVRSQIVKPNGEPVKIRGLTTAPQIAVAKPALAKAGGAGSVSACASWRIGTDAHLGSRAEGQCLRERGCATPEGPGLYCGNGTVQQLLLPVVDLVRMNPKLARQLGDRPVPLDRRQRHLRLERRVVLLPCPLLLIMC